MWDRTHELSQMRGKVYFRNTGLITRKKNPPLFKHTETVREAEVYTKQRTVLQVPAP